MIRPLIVSLFYCRFPVALPTRSLSLSFFLLLSKPVYREHADAHLHAHTAKRAYYFPTHTMQRVYTSTRPQCRTRQVARSAGCRSSTVDPFSGLQTFTTFVGWRNRNFKKFKETVSRWETSCTTGNKTFFLTRPCFLHLNLPIFLNNFVNWSFQALRECHFDWTSRKMTWQTIFATSVRLMSYTRGIMRKAWAAYRTNVYVCVRECIDKKRGERERNPPTLLSHHNWQRAELLSRTRRVQVSVCMHSLRCIPTFMVHLRCFSSYLHTAVTRFRRATFESS